MPSALAMLLYMDAEDDASDNTCMLLVLITCKVASTAWSGTPQCCLSHVLVLQQRPARLMRLRHNIHTRMPALSPEVAVAKVGSWTAACSAQAEQQHQHC